MTEKHTRGPARKTLAKGKKHAPNDDEMLWRHVSQTVERLQRAKPRVPDVEATNPSVDTNNLSRRAKPSGPKHPSGTHHQQPPASSVPKHSHTPPARPVRAPQPLITLPRPPPPSLPDLERRHTRRIADGRIEIDARLDLHGLTERAAHARLTAFITSGAASGWRTVLVITGKGGRARARETHDHMTHAHSGDHGVLRRNVPRWLSEPQLRPLVVGFAPAARNHGGEGAIYIHLRRRR